MNRLSAPLSLEHVDSFFSLDKKVKINTVSGTTLGGKRLDPKTGKAATLDIKEATVNSQRHWGDQNLDQHSYAKYYQKLEEEALVNDVQEDSVFSDSRSKGDDLDTISMSVGSEAARLAQLPNGVTEEEANRVYVNYNFHVNYDETLAIYNNRQEVINTIESNQVTVIQGETGSGKTTQVAQYILDHYSQMNKYCNIIVTQPRRIAAMSIARHICNKRNWTLGQVCGYQVGMDKQASQDTRLLYCTTGVLLQKLMSQKHMNNYTHVILDEVHERDQDMDFALLVVKKLQRSNSRYVKVVLMSATFESNRFARYFGIPIHGQLQPAPVLDIKGRAYTVQQFYLESLKSLGKLPHLDINDPTVDPQLYEIVKLLIQHFDNMEIQNYGSKQTGASGVPPKRGSVLIFLPGLGEINEMDEKLQEIKTKYKLWLLPLHSSITTEEQNRVFRKPEPGVRKVIMSTNIAESSITVPDVKYVIDFCLTKVLMCDPETSYTSLQLQWASKANCIQRRGRAGRVSNGRAYHLVTRDFFMQLPKFSIPEMERCPLDLVVLKVKRLDLGEPKAILGLALDPPALNDIEQTVLKLKEIGALITLDMDEFNPHDGRLTFLGHVMAELPIDVKLGKLILLGHVFGLLEACLIISASLSTKCFFSTPFRAQLEAYRKKFDWADNSFSDCLAYLFAYTSWKKNSELGRFPTLREELRWTKENFIQLHRIRDVEKLVDELRERLKKFNIITPRCPNKPPPDLYSQENQLLLKIILCGAFYPNYFTLDHADEELAVRELSGHNPFSTVKVGGLPSNQGFLYKKNIEDIFSVCDHKKPKVHFEQTKAFIEFHRDPSDSTNKILPAVYTALKIKHMGMKGIKMEFPEMDSETAILQLDQMKGSQDLKISGNNTSRANSMPSIEGFEEDDTYCPLIQVALPPPGVTTINLMPTVIINCGVFWANLADEDTTRKLNELHGIINSSGVQNLPMLPPHLRKVGTFCLAPFTDTDGSTAYYRARIEKLNDSTQTAEVFYVDYGNVETVLYFSLRVLEPHLRCMPYQAIECHLYGIKPSPIKCPNNEWTAEAKEAFTMFMNKAVQCYAKIYSIVHGVLRLEVYLRNADGSIVNMNEKLFSMCYADKAEEDFLSKQNHKQRESLGKSVEGVTSSGLQPVSDRSLELATSVAAMSVQSTASVRRRPGKIRLTGPVHPYEITFFNITKIGTHYMCRVDKGSVNCVALDSEPHNKYSHFMVAGYVGLNHTGNIIQARHTTLMPHIPGLPALITLLFTPKAELRVSTDKKRYTGVLCGLGWDHVNAGPVLGDHDIEITFDTHFDIEDLVMVNDVRFAINLAIGNMDTAASWSDDSLANIQKHVRNKLLKLFQKRREPVEPVYFSKPYHWNQVHPDDICHPKIEEFDFLCTLYDLHCAVSLLPNSDDEDDQ